MITGVWTVTSTVESPTFADRYLEWNDANPTDMLIGSTFSVVAYKSTQKFPERVSLGSANTILQVGGCAAL
jgi:hypothetical protein